MLQENILKEAEYNIVVGYQTFAGELYLMPNELPATHIPFGSIRKVEGHSVN